MEFLDNVSIETVGLETSKMVFNSFVSTPYAKILTIDISIMYLNTPLKDYQCMQFIIKIVPECDLALQPTGQSNNR